MLAMAIVFFANFSINFRLIVPGNAAETARNIMAHETLFRINIACNLIYLATVVVLLAALYVIFRPVSRGLALVAAFCRLVVALMWGVTAVNALSVLRILGDPAYAPVFGVDQVRALARLHLAAGYDAYYVGLPFWGLASTVCGYLWLRSRYVPSVLAVLGMTSSAWCVICAFAFIVFPGFGKSVSVWLFDMPMVVFEMTMGCWLLCKGIRPEPGE